MGMTELGRSDKRGHQDGKEGGIREGQQGHGQQSKDCKAPGGVLGVRCVSGQKGAPGEPGLAWMLGNV